MVAQNFAYLNKARTFLGANGTHSFPPHLNPRSGFDFTHLRAHRLQSAQRPPANERSVPSPKGTVALEHPERVRTSHIP